MKLDAGALFSGAVSGGEKFAAQLETSENVVLFREVFQKFASLGEKIAEQAGVFGKAQPTDQMSKVLVGLQGQCFSEDCHPEPVAVEQSIELASPFPGSEAEELAGGSLKPSFKTEANRPQADQVRQVLLTKSPFGLPRAKASQATETRQVQSSTVEMPVATEEGPASCTPPQPPQEPGLEPQRKGMPKGAPEMGQRGAGRPGEAVEFKTPTMSPGRKVRKASPEPAGVPHTTWAADTPKGSFSEGPEKSAPPRSATQPKRDLPAFSPARSAEQKWVAPESAEVVVQAPVATEAPKVVVTQAPSAPEVPEAPKVVAQAPVGSEARKIVPQAPVALEAPDSSKPVVRTPVTAETAESPEFSKPAAQAPNLAESAEAPESSKPVVQAPIAAEIAEAPESSKPVVRTPVTAETAEAPESSKPVVRAPNTAETAEARESSKPAARAPIAPEAPEAPEMPKSPKAAAEAPSTSEKPLNLPKKQLEPESKVRLRVSGHVEVVPPQPALETEPSSPLLKPPRTESKGDRNPELTQGKVIDFEEARNARKLPEGGGQEPVWSIHDYFTTSPSSLPVVYATAERPQLRLVSTSEPEKGSGDRQSPIFQKSSSQKATRYPKLVALENLDGAEKASGGETIQTVEISPFPAREPVRLSPFPSSKASPVKSQPEVAPHGEAAERGEVQRLGISVSKVRLPEPTRAAISTPTPIPIPIPIPMASPRQALQVDLQPAPEVVLATPSATRTQSVKNAQERAGVSSAETAGLMLTERVSRLGSLKVKPQGGISPEAQVSGESAGPAEPVVELSRSSVGERPIPILPESRTPVIRKPGLRADSQPAEAGIRFGETPHFQAPARGQSPRAPLFQAQDRVRGLVLETGNTQFQGARSEQAQAQAEGGLTRHLVTLNRKSMVQYSATSMEGGEASAPALPRAPIPTVLPAASLVSAAPLPELVPGGTKRPTVEVLSPREGEAEAVKLPQGLVATSPSQMAPEQVEHLGRMSPENLGKLLEKRLSEPSPSRSSRMELELDPERLGRVKIELTMDRHSKKVDTVFVVSNESAREALEHQLPGLKIKLAQQGVEIESRLSMASERHGGADTQSGRQSYQGRKHSGHHSDELASEPERPLRGEGELYV